MTTAAERVKSVLETDIYHPRLEVEVMSIAQLSIEGSGINTDSRSFNVAGCVRPVVSFGPASYHGVPCVTVHIKDEEGEAILVVKSQQGESLVFRILERNKLVYETGGCA